MELVYTYQPRLMFKGLALFCTPLGLMQLGLSLSDLAARRHPSPELAFGGFLMLLTGICCFYSWRTVVVRLHPETQSGESITRPLLGPPRGERFTLGEVERIEVLGNLNFASVNLALSGKRYHPLGRTLMRSEADKTELRARLEELKGALDKPIQVDPTVAKWFEVY